MIERQFISLFTLTHLILKLMERLETTELKAGLTVCRATKF